MICKDCEQSAYSYRFTCEGCKTRFIQRESCKYLRKVLVQNLEIKYGEFQGWKEGETCTCDKVCKRKAAVNKPKEDWHEQQTERKGKKASSRR